MNTLKNIFTWTLAIAGSWLFMVSCAPMESDPKVLLDADLEFSQLSQDSGVHHAFLTFAHDKAVLLRDRSLPVEGKTAMAELYALRPDTGYSLTWRPAFADIAASGDLGYTYGYYTLEVHGDTVLHEGTYVSIWKYVEGEGWKFVLDTGTEGLK